MRLKSASAPNTRTEPDGCQLNPTCPPAKKPGVPTLAPKNRAAERIIEFRHPQRAADVEPDVSSGPAPRHARLHLDDRHRRHSGARRGVGGRGINLIDRVG